MVMTILEARVSKENWGLLEGAFQKAAQFTDAGLVRTFLIQSAKEEELWRILTVWESQEALNAMRNSGEIPRGVLIFRESKAEPALSVFRIAQEIKPDGGG